MLAAVHANGKEIPGLIHADALAKLKPDESGMSWLLINLRKRVAQLGLHA